MCILNYNISGQFFQFHMLFLTFHCILFIITGKRIQVLINLNHSILLSSNVNFQSNVFAQLKIYLSIIILSWYILLADYRQNIYIEAYRVCSMKMIYKSWQKTVRMRDLEVSSREHSLVNCTFLTCMVCLLKQFMSSNE